MKLKSLFQRISKKYLLIGSSILFALILTIVLILVFKDSKISKSEIEGYKNYYSKSTKVSFDFPKDYKVKKIDETFYISKKYKSKKATKPYFVISLHEEYESAGEYLEESTNESKKEYGNTFTPITEMLVTLIGNKYVSKITFSNYYEGEVTIENRYAYLKDNKVYVLSSYENQNNNEEINEIANNIISTLEIRE